MRRVLIVLSMFVILLMPVYASAQTPDRIAILDTFGDYASGEPLSIYGEITSILDGSFLIMQIYNPEGDLCQIQQLTPLPNGSFITDAIPLKGRICGLPGEYEVKLFYGDYTKSTTFNVTDVPHNEPSDTEKITYANGLIYRHGTAIANLLNIHTPVSNHTSNNITELESTYVGLWSQYYTDNLILEIDPLIRPAVSTSMNSVRELLETNEITFEIAKSIDNTIYSAIFHYEIGNKANAINLLNDAFVEIKNINPEKVSNQRALTFDELEDTLLNLMTKTDSVMNKTVKSEIAFIFARGTAPLYTEELSQLIDILSESRYLDVVSRKSSDLYKFVQNGWETLKLSLMGKDSIEELLASSESVSKLYDIAILLRELDNVDRFISSDLEENSKLANILLSDWNALKDDLRLATSVDDILESETRITQMSQVIDISSRISKIIDISAANRVDANLINNWNTLLKQVGNAITVDEILEIVTAFDKTITDLREKRSPLAILEFEFTTMKQKAEIQADYKNLDLINNALKVISTAKNLQSGNHSVTKTDRVVVLLSWVSILSPQIKAELDSYNKEKHNIRAGNILQRAQSLENLVDLSLTKNRFLPNYVEFTEKFVEKISKVRNLVIQNDLQTADDLVRDLFKEWTDVTEAYETDPYGSKAGYSVEELKRIEFRKRLDAYSSAVTNFYHAGFDIHAAKYNKMVEDATLMINLGNFVDVESKISEIGAYLSQYLVLKVDNIMYDISFDVEKDIWVITGAVEKSVSDKRENLYVQVYTMDGSTNSSLEFTDTRQGNFFTQWIAPTEPGLYIVMLQYKDSRASQIVYIEEEFEYEYNESDLNMVELARQYDELRSFAEQFGGSDITQNGKLAGIMHMINVAFADRDAKEVNDNLNALKKAIERYLPIRSRIAVIEASYDVNQLTISGAVQKELAFPEDLFVDVYDQTGKIIYEIALQDNSGGMFSQTLPNKFDPGLYVVQLQHHNVTVNDFFNVP